MTLTIRLSRSTTFLFLVCLLAGLAGGASSSATDENPWQLLDFEDKEILAKIGITDETTKLIGIGIMQNALTRHRDTEVRATCAKVLGRFEAESAGQALVWALRDPHADVRNNAAQALGIIRERRALGPLAELLKKEPGWQNRVTIILAFKAIGDRRAGPVLAEALVKDPDWHVREKAAEAILELKAKRVSKQLIQALSDPHEAVRGKAAHALGAIKERHALDKLIELLNDPHPHARRCAADALGQLGSKKAVKPLIEGLKDSDAYVRRCCAHALGQIESGKAVKPLEELAENDPDDEVRKAAQDAIRRIEHERD